MSLKAAAFEGHSLSFWGTKLIDVCLANKETRKCCLLRF